MIRIYEGLPNALKDRVKWVSDDYRINELSLIPGGTDIVVEYNNSVTWGYDKVKFPSRYIKRILETSVDPLVEVVRVYARAYFDDSERHAIGFTKVWDTTFDGTVEDVLRKFDPVIYEIGKSYSYEVLKETVTDFSFVGVNSVLGERLFTLGLFKSMKEQGEIQISSKDTFTIKIEFSLYDYVNKIKQ